MVPHDSLNGPPGHTAHGVIASFDVTIFWRKKWVLLVFVVASVAVGVAYLQFAPGIYEAEARLLVAREGLGHDPKVDRGEERRRFLATQAEVLGSPVTVLAALQATALKGINDSVPPAVYAQAISVTPMPNSDVLVLRFRSNYEQDTTQVLREVINEFKQEQRQQEMARQQSQLELFTEREASLRQELDAARNDCAKLRGDGPLMGQTKDLFTVQIRRLDQLHESLTQSRNKRLEIESRLATFLASHGMKHADVRLAVEKRAEVSATDSVRTVALKPGEAPSLLPTDAAAPPQGNLVEIEQSRAMAQAKVLSLSQHLLGKHPDLVAAKEELAWWERVSLGRKRLLAQEMDAEIAGLQTTEKTLEREYQDERKRVKEMDEYLAREERLQAHIAELSKTHELALTQLGDVKLNDAAIADGSSGLRIEVLQEPEATVTKVWPKKGPVLALCGALGLILGGAVVALGEARAAANNALPAPRVTTIHSDAVRSPVPR